MTNQQGAPEALRLADEYAAAHAKWALEDLYGTSKSYTAEMLAERHAARERLAAALVEAQQPAPSAAAAVNPDPHAELRKTWQLGQRWQARSFRNGQWGPWTDVVASEPFWFPHQDYRRHPDDLAPQPSPTPQADSQPAPVVDREAVIRAAVAAMPHTNPMVADDLLGGFTMHTEADDVIAIFEAGRAARATADSVTAPAGGEIDRLRAALVYVAFALHGKPQYMLAEGIALIDGDTVRVSRDGWTVEASINPARATPPAQAADRVLEDAAREVLMEHSGCGSGTQVEMLTVKLNPGDKVVMLKGRITQAIAAARKQGGST